MPYCCTLMSAQLECEAAPLRLLLNPLPCALTAFSTAAAGLSVPPSDCLDRHSGLLMSLAHFILMLSDLDIYLCNFEVCTGLGVFGINSVEQSCGGVFEGTAMPSKWPCQFFSFVSNEEFWLFHTLALW